MIYHHWCFGVASTGLPLHGILRGYVAESLVADQTCLIAGTCYPGTIFQSSGPGLDLDRSSGLDWNWDLVIEEENLSQHLDADTAAGTTIIHVGWPGIEPRSLSVFMQPPHCHLAEGQGSSESDGPPGYAAE